MSICANAHAHMKRRDKEADGLKKKKAFQMNLQWLNRISCLLRAKKKKKIFKLEEKWFERERERRTNIEEPFIFQYLS